MFCSKQRRFLAHIMRGEIGYCALPVLTVVPPFSLAIGSTWQALLYGVLIKRWTRIRRGWVHSRDCFLGGGSIRERVIALSGTGTAITIGAVLRCMQVHLPLLLYTVGLLYFGSTHCIGSCFAPQHHTLFSGMARFLPRSFSYFYFLHYATVGVYPGFCLPLAQAVTVVEELAQSCGICPRAMSAVKLSYGRGGEQERGVNAV